jgi:iron complex transport system ATP-binding protein
MNPIILARDVSFSYNDRPALRAVTMDARPGEIVAILGPNGSGKSTLLLALLGHLAVSGEISFDGRPINQWRRRDLARVLAYLPQTPRHEAGQTVWDILRLGRAPYWGAFGLESSQDEQIARDVARQLELDDLLNRRIDEMSGGQRQRVFIGRCLTQEPRALLLDEPTTFLDLKHQIELLKLLRDLAKSKNIAIVLASHELNLAGAFADRLVLLDQGAVAASGRPDEVLVPAILEKVYGVPVQRLEIPGGAPVVVPRFS